MKTKTLKIILCIVFLGFFSLGFGVSNTTAVTVKELKAQIVQLQALITKLQQHLAELQTSASTLSYDFSVDLWHGNTGSEVEALQNVLEKQGFSITQSEKSSKYFGNSTLNAVKSFQTKYKQDILVPYGLSYATGYVGKATRTKLNQIYGYKTEPVFPYEFTSRLIGVQIQELTELNEKKVHESRELERIQREYEKFQTKIWKGKVELQENKFGKVESDLQSILESYGVSEEFQNELDNINAKTNTWIANYNEIFVKPEEYKQKLLGLKKPSDEKTISESPQLLGGSLTTADDSLPDFFDWRDRHGQNYITPIRDQAACGACWAFGAVASLEGVANAYFNDPDLDPDLAEQDLVSCFHGSGCDGADAQQIERIFSNYFQNTGICAETCFPYTTNNNNCANKCSTWQRGVWKTVSYESPEFTKQAIKRTIVENGPVEVGMEVYDDFFAYSGGIYYPVSNVLKGYHAVTIVGYGVFDGADYWIVKNSWGTGWGENGYFRIFAGTCGIDSWFAYVPVIPKAPYLVTKLCNDNDTDGYCNWGLGGKPISGCPVCSDIIEDCDDSNASIFEGCGESEQATGALSITSNPSDAEVYVLDLDTGYYIYRGTTPLIIGLATGAREIKINKNDYEDKIVSVEIVQGQTTYLDVDLFLAPKLTFPLNNDIFRAGDVVEVIGTTGGNTGFQNYVIEYGVGKDPNEWFVRDITLKNGGVLPIENGILATWNTGVITEADFYTVRLTINYVERDIYYEFIKDLYLDPGLKQGWPQRISFGVYEGGEGELYSYTAGLLEPVVSDIDNDDDQEIIIYKKGNPPKILVYRQDGSLLWSVEVGIAREEQLPPPFHSLFVGSMFPVVGDINSDGFNEIVAYNFKSDQDGYSEFFVFDHEGSILEGWPILLPSTVRPTMILADVNMDGNQEIIIQGNKPIWPAMQNLKPRTITIVNSQGRIISQWESQWGFDTSIESSLAVGNFDDDPKLEIVFIGRRKNSENNNEGVICVYNLDGSIVEGWPVYAGGIIVSSPAVGDINNDGELEIVVGLSLGLEEPPSVRSGGVYAFDKHGNVLPGWPFKKGWDFFSSPSLADFDGDGDLEIVVSEKKSYYSQEYDPLTHVIHHNGALASGWPQSSEWDDSYSTIVGDINGDNISDVLMTAGDGFRDGGVYAWNFDGSLIEGFPKATELDARAPVVIADIDNDGYVELIASSHDDYDWAKREFKRRGTIYVWETGGIYDSSTMHWPMFQHDSQHTGLYKQPLEEKSIAVLSPNGGEKWIEGKAYTIKWEQEGLDQDKVDIQLGGYGQEGNLIREWYQIAEDIPAVQQEYNWQIPFDIDQYFQESPSKYKIRIVKWLEAPPSIDISDESDDYFSIKGIVECLDIDCDGLITLKDVAIVQDFWRKPISYCPICDIDNDADIDVADIQKIASNINKETNCAAERKKCCIVGCYDVNCDGAIDLTDTNIASTYWKKTSEDCLMCDIDQDGDIDIVDIQKVASNVGKKISELLECSSTPVLTLSVDLEAIPSLGTVPLNNVDLKATVSGTAQGTINYKFDCQNDGIWDSAVNATNTNPYTALDLCNYVQTGNYTAKVRVERGTLLSEDTVTISVSQGITLPSVSTNDTTLIEETTSILNGEITNTGGANADQRGFDWGLTTSYGSSWTETGSYGTGTFGRGITGLNMGTIYHFQAKAHNSIGWGYGTDKTFYTKPGDPSNLTATTQSQTQVNLTWLKGAGADKTKVLRKTGSYPSSIFDGTLVYFGTATGLSYTGLSCGTTYYYRAWAYDTKSGYYSDGYSQASAITSSCIDLPTVQTNDASDIQIASAQLNGNLIGMGGADSCEVWFEWEEATSGLPFSNSTSHQILYSLGSFSTTITGLTSGTKYGFYGRAKNSAGIFTDLVPKTFTTKKETCEGVEWNGYCWYEGGEGETCASVCSSHGGNAGVCQENDNSSCDLCHLFHLGAGCIGINETYDPIYFPYFNRCDFRASPTGGSCTSSNPGGRRFCACNISNEASFGEKETDVLKIQMASISNVISKLTRIIQELMKK